MLTLTLIIGIVVGLILSEITAISAGAIIAPGYIALLMDQPDALLSILAAVVATHAVVSLLVPHLSLYGTRRLSVTILVGLVFATGIEFFRGEGITGPLVWAGLGYVIPGLIAHQWYRQGFLVTALLLVTASALTRALAVGTAALLA